MEIAPGNAQPEAQTCAEQSEKSRSVPRICHAESQTVFTIAVTLPGHLSDRTFFAKPVVVWSSSLLSVIDIDSVICLSPSDTSFVHFIALFGKAATAPYGKNGE
jgi:hypothetical protein